MSGIDEQVAALPKLGRAGLQQRWHDVFKSASPATFTPDAMGN